MTRKFRSISIHDLINIFDDSPYNIDEQTVPNQSFKPASSIHRNLAECSDASAGGHLGRCVFARKQNGMLVGTIRAVAANPPGRWNRAEPGPSGESL